jgi:hypothetical protein
MSAQKLLLVFLIADTFLLSACGKSPTFTCEQGQPASGDIVDVKGGGHTLLTSPDANAAAVVNEKASQIVRTTQYHSIDSSTRVQIQCEKEEWVKVQLTMPEWLTHVKGWTKRQNLLPPRAPGAFRTFTEEDIFWDEDTSKYKGAITQAINQIHRKVLLCKDYIQPATVALSSSKSRPNKLVFYITCGVGTNFVNVYFTQEGVVLPWS